MGHIHGRPLHRRGDNLPVSHFQFPGIASVRCLFTGRGQAGGLAGNISFKADAASAREARAEILAAAAPLGLTAVAECRQVHGVKILREPQAGDFTGGYLPLEDADGMMTAGEGVGLLIKTADCQPILLCDAAGEHIMALHCGWRGNRQHFPTLAISSFCACYGLRPEEIYAVRGPSLGFAQFENFAAEWDASFAPWYDEGRHTMDLWQLTAAQLAEAGVPRRHIYSLDICTWANADACFSWRRHRDSGRQGALIWITPRP